ncbi:MAG: hypothetical protein R3C16_10045 [Hyphomonadaceae bacterium]
MAWFRVFACGEDFPVVLDGEVVVAGFYTTRYVEAETASDAEAAACDLLFDDPDLEPPPGWDDVQPRIMIEEVEQVAEPVDIDGNFSFFPMEDDPDAEDY